MKVTVKEKGRHPVSSWAGGTTTQLYLYPEDSEYAKRNFIFRLSSATVDCERSEFTALPGVERIIMPLHGSLHLYYEGHGERVLQEYEQDRFDGGWNTTSVGRATDFNLMLRQGAVGSLEAWELEEGQQRTLDNEEGSMLAFYITEGCCQLIGESTANLSVGSLMAVSGAGTVILQNIAGDRCKLVCAKVRLP